MHSQEKREAGQVSPDFPLALSATCQWSHVHLLWRLRNIFLLQSRRLVRLSRCRRHDLLLAEMIVAFYPTEACQNWRKSAGTQTFPKPQALLCHSAKLSITIAQDICADKCVGWRTRTRARTHTHSNQHNGVYRRRSAAPRPTKGSSKLMHFGQTAPLGNKHTHIHTYQAGGGVKQGALLQPPTTLGHVPSDCACGGAGEY
eukprot:1158443-Pelagomonas_calceolata.AAC.20